MTLRTRIEGPGEILVALDGNLPVPGGIAPSFTSPPSIPSDLILGVEFSVTPGVVTGNPAPTVSRRLFRDGVVVGALGLTYTPVEADVGAELQARESASNGVSPDATATSNTSNPVTDPSVLPSGTQLLDFDGAAATFSRSLEGSNGDASARSSDAAFADIVTNTLRTETIAGVARFLFEGQRANLAPNADTLNIGYTKTSALITEDQHASPTGEANAASEMTISAASGRVYPTVANASTEDNQRITHSVWIRHISGGNKIRFSLRGRDNVLIQGGAEFDVGTEW
ncbi:MAG: hypothetical protein AAF411_22735, partial [Myxococcota bacterium]